MLSTNLSCNGSDSQKTEILESLGGGENPKATLPAKQPHNGKHEESPRRIASRKQGWVNGMEIDTKFQEGEQNIQGEEGEGGGEE